MNNLPTEDEGVAIPSVARERMSGAGPNPTVKLRMAGVTKSFGTGAQAVEALKPVDLAIVEGEYVVLFGPSGCGKSTLLNLVAGFEDPTAGEIYLDGQVIDGPGNDRLMMFQEHGLFPWLNVIDNVMY